MKAISFPKYQFSSGTQLCLTLCDPMNCGMPGLPVHHQLPEFTQTHIHRVNDAIQPSHPLSSPSPPAPNPSQHQGLFEATLHMSCFSFSIIPSKEIPGLISFRMDWRLATPVATRRKNWATGRKNCGKMKKLYHLQIPTSIK